MTRLAIDFENVSESDWRLLVERSLRGRPLDSLTAKSDDGLAVGPIHKAAPAPVIARGDPGLPWTVVQRVEDPDIERATRALADDLEGGAGGIELVFAGGASAHRTGFGLGRMDGKLIATLSRTDKLHLRLDAGDATWSMLDDVLGLRLDRLTLACDPMALAAARGGFSTPLATIESRIVHAARSIDAREQNGTAVEADGRIWAAAGASEAQELTAIFASLVHYARLLIGAGLPSEAAFRHIGITLDAGSNQLLTIAKVRAARLIHARLVEAFGLAPVNSAIHAETSWRMMTRRDVHTNLLRATSTAFAAAIGGADSITVLPFTIALGLPDAFARRIARCLQIILIEEAGLARVSDPGRGAGAVHDLTASLAEAAWEGFRRIEAEGGILAALRTGSLQKDVAAMRDSRRIRIARREIAITGVSEFPALNETSVAVLSPPPHAVGQEDCIADSLEALPATRLAEPFEALRDRADTLVAAGKAPKIFLARLGTRIDTAEGAQAAANFFAAGGIRTVEADGSGEPETIADAFAVSRVSVACIVGTPKASGILATPTASALRARGAARVYVIGPYEGDAEVDAVLDGSTDALRVLGEILDLSC